jgi:hypothetical protein
MTLPAQSLIKSVCYPESYKFSSRATGWGCEHEKFARDIFLDTLKLSHDNVKLEEVGFFIQFCTLLVESELGSNIDVLHLI